MKKRATRKYGNGTSGVSVQNYMQSPAEIMAENNIFMAEAEAEAQSNPWAKGVVIGSSLLAKAVGSGGLSKEPTEVAALGSSGIKGNAEVEGGEAYETPMGEVGEFEGATHENGGIAKQIVPANQPLTEGTLPEKTKIYSDRIIRDGKKLSDKKLERDKKQSRLEKLLEKNSDVAMKNSVGRKLQALEREEADDLRFQEIATQFDELAKFAFGTGKEGVKKMENGINSDDAWWAAMSDVRKAEGYAPQTEDEKKKEPGYLPTYGDIIGLAGDAYSAFAPMENTLANRASDTPNVNAFKDYGKKSLETLNKAGEGIGLERDLSRQRLASASRASKKSGRANARGINQVRASDLAVDVAANQSEQNLDLNYQKQVMDLLTKKAATQGNIDQVVMGGEKERDKADREDKDNFYTQLGKDKATKGQGIQQIGKDINEIAMNPQMLKLLQQLGKYVSYDNKGNLIAKTTE